MDEPYYYNYWDSCSWNYYLILKIYITTCSIFIIYINLNIITWYLSFKYYYLIFETYVTTSGIFIIYIIIVIHIYFLNISHIFKMLFAWYRRHTYIVLLLNISNSYNVDISNSFLFVTFLSLKFRRTWKGVEVWKVFPVDRDRSFYVKGRSSTRFCRWFETGAFLLFIRNVCFSGGWICIVPFYSMYSICLKVISKRLSLLRATR